MSQLKKNWDIFLARNTFLGSGPKNSLPAIMDKSVDTFEQNKHFLSAFFPSFKSILFVDSETPLSPFSMLKYAPWTRPRDYNIEKGRGGGNVKIKD